VQLSGTRDKWYCMKGSARCPNLVIRTSHLEQLRFGSFALHIGKRIKQALDQLCTLSYCVLPMCLTMDDTPLYKETTDILARR
jgi:hypothetical protein